MIRLLLVSLILAMLPTDLSQAVADEPVGTEIPFKITRISPDACRRVAQMAAYQGDGSADYISGITADGREVAPADLDGGISYVPGVYSFPVQIEAYGGSHPHDAFAELEAAMVTIDTVTGRIAIDGQEIGGADRALAEACARKSR